MSKFVLVFGLAVFIGMFIAWLLQDFFDEQNDDDE